MTSGARAALAAVSFLTRVPVGRAIAFSGADVARGAPLFPLVGAAVGGVVAVTGSLAARELPPLLAAALALAAGALLTGVLHLDALADAADGLGGRTREDALRIMREHTVGAYGAVALISVLLVKTIAVGALLAVDGGAWALVAAGGLSRAAIVPLAVALPSARAGDGKGRVLEGAGLPAALVATALGVLLSLSFGLRGLVLAACVGLFALAWGGFCRRRFGGVTGDLLGACSELAETLVLVVAVAIAT